LPNDGLGRQPHSAVIVKSSRKDVNQALRPGAGPQHRALKRGRLVPEASPYNSGHDGGPCKRGTPHLLSAAPGGSCP